MGEIHDQMRGVHRDGGDLPEIHEITAKIKLPKQPNKDGRGTEFPCTAVLFYADGTKMTFPIRPPKPSKASGALNAWGGGKTMLEDSTPVIIGINITVLE